MIIQGQENIKELTASIKTPKQPRREEVDDKTRSVGSHNQFATTCDRKEGSESKLSEHQPTPKKEGAAASRTESIADD